jgi:hypothetical protein
MFSRFTHSRFIKSPFLRPEPRSNAVAAAVAAASFIGSAINTVDGTSFTFTSQDIGAADGTRLVVVAVVAAAGTASDPTSVTIGGNGATKAVGRTESTIGTVSIWYLAVATGTTANIVVNFSASHARCGIGVFRLVNLVSNTPTATGTGGGSGITTANANVNVTGPNGIVVAVGNSTNTAVATHTWTGVTESYDQTVEGTTAQSGGFASGLATETPRTINDTISTANILAVVSAAWH